MRTTPVADIQKTTEATQFDPDKHVDQCFVCGRGLTRAAVERGWYVRLLTNGSLVAAGDEVTETRLDQGWFPVGSECAKQVPREFRTRRIPA